MSDVPSPDRLGEAVNLSEGHSTNWHWAAPGPWGAVIERLTVERDEARAEVERLRAELDNFKGGGAYRDEVGSLTSEVERLRAVVQAVRDLHKPTPGSLGMGSPYTYCDVEGVSAPWPCLTVEALDAALEQENNR